jgi:hypothetical protein
MTRGAKSRFKRFDETIALYRKREVVKFGISPILQNQVLVERLIKEALSPYLVEATPYEAFESFRVSEEMVEAETKKIVMDVLRSCMWPACEGYFNFYGKHSVRPLK